MGKYRSYAMRLDNAFKSSREEYLETWDKLKKAQEAADRAGRSGDQRAIDRADFELKEAKRDMHEAQNNIFPEFLRMAETIRAEMEAEINDTGCMNPDDVDSATMTILQSGACSIRDYISLLERFSGNVTMERLIGAAAEKFADNERNEEERRALRLAVYQSKQRQGAGLGDFDALVNVARICCGHRGDRVEPPSYVERISKKWEQLVNDVIEAF